LLFQLWKQIPYIIKKFLWLKKNYGRKDNLGFIGQYGIPVLVYYEGNFYILAESVRKAQEDELFNWDAEKYCRNIV